jgi:hypothetical protein
MERKSNNPADPWSIDYFNPPTPHVKPPAPTKPFERTQKLVPDVDRLFTVQDCLIRAINACDRVEQLLKHSEPKGFRELQRNLEDAYKGINKYLKEFGVTGGNTF